jgi:Phosphoesterase family
VPPPAVDGDGYGFRVPALMISPYSRRGEVDHTTLDYTGILRFIEDNWQVAPLGTRDASSPGLASAFDFTAPPRPPELVNTDRTPPPVNTRARWVVYGSYGGMLLIAVAAAVTPASSGAAARRSRHERHDGRPPGRRADRDAAGGRRVSHAGRSGTVPQAARDRHDPAHSGCSSPSTGSRWPPMTAASPEHSSPRPTADAASSC